MTAKINAQFSSPAAGSEPILPDEPDNRYFWANSSSDIDISGANSSSDIDISGANSSSDIDISGPIAAVIYTKGQSSTLGLTN